MDKSILILIGVFIFCFLTLLLLYKKMKDGFGTYNLKIFGITLIVFASVIVALSDISADKTAACFGILGSIGGYLFGLKNSDEK